MKNKLNKNYMRKWSPSIDVNPTGSIIKREGDISDPLHLIHHQSQKPNLQSPNQTPVDSLLAPDKGF